ncbi:hypothetical protein E6C70_09120 [Glaciibacter flavus]|uniref:Uncharacterized protein n=1 Tax=Orlajensenia flava TaxID=2565934 RepID=A0A4S4FVR0_9MICO|nr:hypothetical protein [Glaciibacter flavus]THG34418.1 hypothetical protein E6C70_09120 [Glaciibacter flavus]
MSDINAPSASEAPGQDDETTDPADPGTEESSSYNISPPPDVDSEPGGDGLPSADEDSAAE